MRSISAVDLFCGAGGLTYGFQQAGLRVNAGYDIDPNCKFPYKHNNKTKFIAKNVEDIRGYEIARRFPKSDIKVLAGCAPCQPFSTYSRRYSDRSSKWKILDDFARLVKDSMPEVVTMENVPQLKRHKVFKQFTTQLEKLDYFCSDYEVDYQDYGIPQSRKRLVFFASKFGEIKLITTTHNPENYQTVRNAISQLEPLAAGKASKTDRLHRCSKLSKLNLRRIRASKPGGTWRDWPENSIAKCHLKNSGKTYPAVYGRMEWDYPSPTITRAC